MTPDQRRSSARKRAIAASIVWLSFPVTAWACGSMGLDDPRIRNTLTAAVFLPMVALIPVEMGLLRWVGGLGHRMITAYLACLPAKVAGVFLVWYAAELSLIQGVVAAELAYSIGHCLISYLVLSQAFQLKGKALTLTSVLISTVIPWLYSLGLWQIARTVFP